MSVPGSSSADVGWRPCSRIGFFSPAMMSRLRLFRTAATDVVPAGQRRSCHQFDSGRTLRSISSKVTLAATCDWL